MTDAKLASNLPFQTQINRRLLVLAIALTSLYYSDYFNSKIIPSVAGFSYAKLRAITPFSDNDTPSYHTLFLTKNSHLPGSDGQLRFSETNFNFTIFGG